MNQVYIITGVTCSGKTQKSIELAKELDGEIISCDSVQIYCGMDIGSAKPTQEEMSGIRHHLIDVAPCSKPFDVAEYITLAKSALADITSRGKTAIVCGGSGFYLRAWFAAVTDNITIPQDVKETCDALELLGNDAMVEALLKIDSEAAKSVDIFNSRRVKNALARCMASGKRCAELLENFNSLPCPMGELTRKVQVLDRPDDELKERIRIRTASMIENGLIDEARKLILANIKDNPSASLAIGYRETINWLETSQTSTESLAEEISANTFALVKKQRKYFRNALFKNCNNYTTI